jgi:hypothetical protein
VGATEMTRSGRRSPLANYGHPGRPLRPHRAIAVAGPTRFVPKMGTTFTSKITMLEEI